MGFPAPWRIRRMWPHHWVIEAWNHICQDYCIVSVRWSGADALAAFDRD